EKERRMFEECSPAVERAINAAVAWRERLGAERLAAGHLFLALLEDEDGRAWDLLTRHGLPVAECRGGGTALPAERSPPVVEVVARGKELARRHGDDATITSDFFLLAILRTD